MVFDVTRAPYSRPAELSAQGAAQLLCQTPRMLRNVEDWAKRQSCNTHVLAGTRDSVSELPSLIVIGRLKLG
jgi:hypothetical protein